MEKNEKILKRFINDVKEHKVRYSIIGLITVAVIVCVCILLGHSSDKIKEYIVTFDTNGGSYIEPITVKEGDTVSKPTDPTKEGFSFAGWYYNEELYDFNTPVTSDITLEAKWGASGKVSGISLDKTELELYVGDTYTFLVTIMPKDAENKNVTWESSAPDVVSVDAEGNIKALKVGTAVITVTTKDGGYTAKATITVKEKENKKETVKVTGVSLNKKSLTLTEGETYKLVATVKPSNATNKNVTWKSSAPDVVSVDAKGKIKALKVGTAVITVTTKDGRYTAKATITVKEKPSVKVTGVSLDKTSLTLTEGGTSKLVATVNPSNATNKDVTWKSSAPDVVSVDENGNIRALKAGTAVITVTTKDGGYTATCTVTVKEKPASYSIIVTPVVQEVTGAVVQYSLVVTKNSSSFTGYNFVIYNNTKVSNGHYIALNKYNKNISSAKIRLNDGTDVTANIIYK